MSLSPSAQALWDQYRQMAPDAPDQPYECFHFCDNQADADDCADLVLRDIKRATAASVAELELIGMRQPVPGDVSIVTRWNGEAIAIIKTTEVEIRRWADVDEAFAFHEGEGDRSLRYWRSVHEPYYRRVLEGSDVAVDDDLLIVCEKFERVL